VWVAFECHADIRIASGLSELVVVFLANIGERQLEIVIASGHVLHF
jgi:hypothetical protein